MVCLRSIRVDTLHKGDTDDDDDDNDHNVDIHMEFGLEKYAKITFKRGKLTHFQNLVIGINREIQELEQGKTYKYLGIEEGKGI